jgi:hypothetical protein
MAKWYAATSVTPSENSSIQKVPNPGDYTALNDGDVCFMIVDGIMRVYVYDASSALTEDIPNTITPDGNSGNGRWIQEEMSTALRFFYGVIAEKFNATVTSDGATVTMSLENTDTNEDLTAIFNSGRHSIDTTPAATLTLTAGSDSSPTENYVYILESAPTTLALSTTDWPAAEHIKIAFFLVPSAAEVQDHGVWVNQNWNDGTADESTGHMIHMAENMRLTMGGSVYHSGVDANGVDGYVTITTNGGALDNVDWVSTAGVSYQMHRHTIPAYNMGTGDDAHVVNWNGDAYHEIADINEITVDANGVALSNKYFNLVFWFANNKTGEYSPLMVNLPTGSYNNLTDAQNDTSGYDVYDIPKAFNRESSTGMLVCRLTFNLSPAAGGTWSLENTTDLRGRTPGTASGSSLASQVEFPDNTFRIFDEADDTRKIAFVADGITTGNTRTITPADADMTLLSTTQYTDLTDGGDTDLHTHDTLETGGVTAVTATVDGADINDTSGSDTIVTLKSSVGANLAQLKATGSRVDLGAYNGSIFNGGMTVIPNGETWINHLSGVSLASNSEGITVRDPSANEPTIFFTENTGATEYLKLMYYGTGGYARMMIKPSGGSYEDTIRAYPDGAVQLYYDNGLKIATASGGVEVTGSITGLSSPFSILDSAGETHISMTANGAVSLYYDNNSMLETEVSAVRLNGNIKAGVSPFYITDAASEVFVAMTSNGAVDLYYDNATRLSTTSTGIQITNSSDTMTMYYNASDWLIDSNTHGARIILQGENTATGAHKYMGVFDPDGAVFLYNDGNPVVATIASGLFVRGVSGGSGVLQLARNDGANTVAQMTAYTDDHLYLDMSTANGLFIIRGNSGTENMAVFRSGDGCELYYDNTKMLDVLTNGISIFDSTDATHTLQIYHSGDQARLINRKHGGTTALAAEDAGGTIRSLVAGDPDGAVDLYYDGTKVSTTEANGLRIYGGGTNEGRFVHDGVLKIQSVVNSSNVTLLSKDSGGADTSLLVGDPDGAVLLYHDGTERMRTLDQGIRVTGSSGTISIFEDSSNQHFRGNIDDMDVLIQGTNSSSVVKTLFAGNPDGSSEMYYAGTAKIYSHLDGAEIRSILYLGDSTSDGSWRFTASGDNLLIQQRESGTWNTKSTISGA